MAVNLYTDHPAFRVWDKNRYGGKMLLSTYWADYLRADPDLSHLVMCIDVVFGVDKRVFISSRECNTTSTETGAEYNYLPVMSSEPPISNSIDIGSGNSSARSFSFTLPNELVDAASLISKGRMLAGVAEVSLQYDGGDYDNRLVLMRGEMDSGVNFFPADGGTIEFSITDPKESMDLSLPPYVVDNVAFRQAPKESIGRRYPIVANSYEWVPCIWVSGTASLQQLMVGIGDLDVQSGGSDSIYVDGVAYGTTDITYGWSVFRGNDDKGVPYTGIEFTNNPSTEYTEAVYVKVSRGVSSQNPIGQALYFLEEYSTFGKASINYQAFSLANNKASSLKSTTLVNAGSGNDATTLSFIEQGLLGCFPMVSMAWMLGGYGPVFVDRNGAKVGFKLNAQTHPVMGRATAVSETAKNKSYNSFTVEYKFNAMENVYEGVVLADHTNNALCNVSAQNIGLRQHISIQCPYINDDQTAGLVVDWLVSHLSLPSYYVEYECIASAMFSVSLGDNISLTDDEFGWENESATIVSITYQSGRVVLGARVWSPYYAKLDGDVSTYSIA